MSEKQTTGERIAEDWACGRLPGTVAEAIDAALAKAKALARPKKLCPLCGLPDCNNFHELQGPPNWTNKSDAEK